jgi:iron complex outermembrane receptor protein
MQSAFHQQPKLRLSLIAVACQLACFAAGANAQTSTPQKVDADAGQMREVVITGKKIGMGLMVTEDAPKARSTITAEELEKQRPTGNAYEALEMLPSVNSYNYDATGLFGGGLSLRGFNSDQIGATINGVPVNDSGNFAVYPQEYVDQENTCSEFVTQGSTDVDSPQVGASGGNFGIVTCKPEDKQRVRLMQTFGQLNMRKSFVRYDTGLFSDKRSKAFISYSAADADKWKGEGSAHREHIDAGFNYDWDKFNYIHATLLWNRAVNNSINNLTLAEIQKNGYNYDTSPTFVGHLTPVKGTVQKEGTQTPPYYGLYNNPFKNGIFSAIAKFRVTDNTDIKIVPYYWYGFGNGGIQQKAMSETGFYNSATGKNNAAVDLNGDGDTLDTVLMANASVTHTKRPGVTTSVIHHLDNHEILAGFWYERANHQQTGPMVPVAADGSYDVWLQDGAIRRPNGTFYESRDNRTISTAYQLFLQDTISLLDDKASINIGVRNPHIKRDVTNFASEANTVGTYNIARTYSTPLPQFGARYRITNDDQIFMSIAKNMKAPPNFVFSNLNTNVRVINGVPSLTSDVSAETSWNTDIGYRHQDSRFIATLTVFGVNFKNRQASYFDPVNNASYYTNVGDVKSKGFEIEANNMPINGWSLYGSFGYLKTEMQDNMKLNVPANSGLSGILPTAGLELPGSPRLKGGLSLEYSNNGFWTRVKAKATSKQESTFAHDEPAAPGYTVFGLDGGYTFADYGIMKRPKLTVNVSNLTSKQYRNPGSGIPNSNPVPGVTNTTSALRYYLGAPRFISATLSFDI